MMKRLADIAVVQTGFPFREKVVPDPEGTLAVIQMKDIDDSAGLQLDGCTMINYNDKRYSKHLLNVGDVVIQSRGSKFPAATIDKTILAIAALGLMVIHPEGISPEYLAWVLNQGRTREALRSVSQGTYVPFISRAALEALQIPVPAMEVQQKLVSIAHLRRREEQLSTQLIALKNQYIDAQVWKAAASKTRS